MTHFNDLFIAIQIWWFFNLAYFFYAVYAISCISKKKLWNLSAVDWEMFALLWFTSVIENNTWLYLFGFFFYSEWVGEYLIRLMVYSELISSKQVHVYRNLCCILKKIWCVIYDTYVITIQHSWLSFQHTSVPYFRNKCNSFIQSLRCCFIGTAIIISMA